MPSREGRRTRGRRGGADRVHERRPLPAPDILVGLPDRRQHEERAHEHAATESQPTATRCPPTSSSRKARRAAPSSSCRRSSASTRTSAASPSSTPPKATSRLHRPCSIASQKDVDLGYDAKGIEQGVGLMMRTTNESTLADLDAAIAAVSHAGRVGMVGYCWGGRSTYLAGLPRQHRRGRRLLRRRHTATAAGHAAHAR